MANNAKVLNDGDVMTLNLRIPIKKRVTGKGWTYLYSDFGGIDTGYIYNGQPVMFKTKVYPVNSTQAEPTSRLQLA